MKRKLCRVSFYLVIFCIMLLPAFHVKARTTIRLSKPTVKLKPGQSKKIRLKGVSSGKVKWSSSNKSVATVKKGKITAYRGGKAVIKARARGKTYRCKVTVISVNYTKATIAKNKKIALKVKNGSHTKWSSGDPSIASVNKKGIVTGKKTGKTFIICKSNGKTFRIKIYVAALDRKEIRLAVDNNLQINLKNTGNAYKFSSKKSSVVSTTKDGLLTAIKPGNAIITCKTGKAVLTCKVNVISPDNLTTSLSMLPAVSDVNRQELVVNGYPSARTYTVYRQSADENKTDGAGLIPSSYMPNHGCAACALATVLSGYKGYKKGPAYVVEAIEKKVFKTKAWTDNYSKASSGQMPMSLYGISRILTYYQIPNTYVRNFPGTMDENNNIADNDASDILAYKEILKHLKTGNPAVIVVSSVNRKTGIKDKLWSNSYHTMVLLGITSSGKAIVADSANRSPAVFGKKQRVKYTSLKSLIPYMFSSVNIRSSALYWSGKNSCGGYILVHPRN